MRKDLRRGCHHARPLVLGPGTLDDVDDSRHRNVTSRVTKPLGRTFRCVARKWVNSHFAGGPIACPLRGRLSGLDGALLVICKLVLLCGPGETGLNATSTVQV